MLLSEPSVTYQIPSTSGNQLSTVRRTYPQLEIYGENCKKQPCQLSAYQFESFKYVFSATVSCVAKKGFKSVYAANKDVTASCVEYLPRFLSTMNTHLPLTLALRKPETQTQCKITIVTAWITTVRSFLLL